MAINIKNEETTELIRALAEKTGETQTEAITTAVRERLARIEREQRTEKRVRDIMEIGRKFSELLKGEKIDIDAMLYDEHGLPK